jgi:beta-hydroxylase
VQGEEVGALSKTFAALYPIRVLGKRIKQHNRPLYFTLKYLLVAVVLYLIFFWR